VRVLRRLGPALVTTAASLLKLVPPYRNRMGMSWESRNDICIATSRAHLL